MSQSHSMRVRAAALSLDAATDALLAFTGALPGTLATTPLIGGWTPASHVWHVAMTNAVFSGLLRGDGPIKAEPGRSDFTDAQWSFESPAPVAAPDIIMPPADAAPVAAADRLRQSVAELRPLIEMMNESLGTQTARLPWARISVYQVAEWAAGHTLRHLAQVGRELHRSSLRSTAGH